MKAFFYLFVFKVILSGISCKKDSKELEEILKGGTEENFVGHILPGRVEKLELQQSKFLIKLEELQRLLLQQKQKLKIIEKTTNISRSTSSFSKEKTKRLGQKNPKKDIMTSEIKPIELTQFHKKLDLAIKLFEADKVGKAIINFITLNRSYKNSITKGVCIYWLGRSWLKLKEYSTARSLFSNFIENNERDDKYSDVEYWLAKADIALGHKSQAVSRLNKIIYQYKTTSHIKLLAKKVLHRLNNEEG